MKQSHALAAVMAAGLASTCLTPARAASYVDPSTTQTFQSYTAGMTKIGYYTFGTGAGRAVGSLGQLATIFDPVGIAGYTTIQNEWERYQPFNGQNFVFTPYSLDLTATLAGGLSAGGINSGQIWTKAAYKPGLGAQVYAMKATMKIPEGQGMWPAFWLYSQQGPGRTTSEVDVAEFQVMKWQNTHDWTGYNHQPLVGSTIYDLRANGYTWKPGIDFAAGYHDYELIWTPDATYKYVDGQLIYAQHYTWTSGQPAQLGVNLAVGSSNPDAPGLIPTSAAEFPAVLSVDHISIWSK